jgi:hypothetical protein
MSKKLHGEFFVKVGLMELELKSLIDFMHSDDFAKMNGVNQGLVMIQQVHIEGLIDVLKRRIELL